MYDFDELAAFDTVMTLGSLTHSARKLGLAKSTLSRRITQLERRLGQPLLRRQSNRLLPTEAGQLFHAYCQQILETAEQGRQALEELSEEISGKLQVITHNALARSWLAPCLAEFMHHYSNVRVTLQTGSVSPVSLEGSSVAVWLGETSESGFRQDTLGWLSRGIYAHPDYLARHGRPQHPEALAQHAWIDLLGEAEHGLILAHRQQGEFCFQPPESRFSVDQQTLQGDAIALGHGIGIMPDWLAARRKRAHPGSLTRCLPEWSAPPLPVTLLYTYGPRPRRLSTLLAFLQQHTPEEWSAAPEEPTPSHDTPHQTAVANCATQRCTPAV